jgi:NAD-dependent dihydropyrimidine dehydrogenase PreA subunit
MGRFVGITIEAGALDRASSDAVVRACPVDIFTLDAAGRLATIERNEDECILCGRCVELASGAVTVHRRYGAAREVPAGGGSDG